MKDLRPEQCLLPVFLAFLIFPTVVSQISTQSAGGDCNASEHGFARGVALSDGALVQGNQQVMFGNVPWSGDAGRVGHDYVRWPASQVKSYLQTKQPPTLSLTWTDKYCCCSYSGSHNASVGCYGNLGVSGCGISLGYLILGCFILTILA